MAVKFPAFVLALAAAVNAQTQIDLNRQVRNALPLVSGGTGATSRAGARKNVGPTSLVATDFAGSDIGSQVSNAFASFGGGQCGTVVIPPGSYTFSNTIYVATGCSLEGSGDSFSPPFGTRLIYSGPPATAAVALMNSDMTAASFAHLRNLAIVDGNSSTCTNNGMLAWNPAAGGSNKWQCYDGTSYTTATVHVAAVLHGQIDPTVLADGIHNTIDNVAIDGDAGENFPHQGGFHFGLYLNGCEECIFNNVTVQQADDGFYVGTASNGIIFNQITGRINRRSGFHYRGGNHFLCNECLFESNEWFGNRGTDVTKYGAGIRIGGGDFSGDYLGGQGGKFVNVYFENNDIDLFGPPTQAANIDIDACGGGAVFSDRAQWFNSRVVGCVNPIDGANSTVNGALVTDSAITTVDSSHFAIAAGAPFYRLTELEGNPNAPPFPNANTIAIWTIAADNTNSIYTKGYGLDDALNGSLDLSWTYATLGGAVNLSPYKAASSGITEVQSAPLILNASHWNGTSPDAIAFKVQATQSNPGGGSDSSSGLSITANKNGSNASRQFEFREKAVLEITDNNAGDTPTLNLGLSRSPAGQPNDNSTPTIAFTYRSDGDTTGAHIKTNRSGATASQGKTFFDMGMAQFGAGSGGPFTMNLMAGSSQTANLQQWYDTSGSLAAYMRPDGGLALQPGASQPACSSSTRFLFWTIPGAAGVKDSVQVCAKDAANAYAWRTIY